MAPNLQYITVTGTYVDVNGTPMGGNVTFTPPPLLLDCPDQEIIVGHPIIANLDFMGRLTDPLTGAVGVRLLANNNANIAPTGWTYGVTENVSSDTRSYNILTPYGGGNPVPGSNIYDLACVSPAAPNPGTIVLPTGPAGGDLSGAYPNPIVTSLHLSQPVPITMGGTGQTTAPAAAAAIGAPTTAQPLAITGTPTAGQSLVAISASAATWQNAVSSTVLNVKDYGAKGDGTTNDTTAFQNAVTAAVAAGGGTIYAPPGTYILSRCNLASNVVLEGAGMGATILKLDPAATVGSWVIRPSPNDSTPASFVGFKDLTIDGNKSAFPTPTGKYYGLYIGTGSTISDIYVNRVEARNCVTYAMDLVGATRVQFTDCWSHDNGISGQSFGNCSGYEILGDDVTLTNCKAFNNVNHGFTSGESATLHYRTKLIGCSSWTNGVHGVFFHDFLTLSEVIGGCYQGNTGSGIVFASNSTRCVVSGAAAAANAVNGIRLDNAKNCTAIGNVLDTNGTASSGNPDLNVTSGSTGCLVADNQINSLNATNSLSENGSTTNGNTFTGNIYNKNFPIVGSTTTTDLIKPGVYNVLGYGAKADGLIATDAVMTAGSPNVSCASAPFGTAVAGMLVMVHGAGASGVTSLVTTILSVTDSGHIVLAANAATSVSNARIMWGSDNSAAFTACANAAVTWARAHSHAATVYIPPANGSFYAFGAVTTGGTTLGNAHVPLPIIPTTESKVTLVFQGASFGASTQHWEQTVPTFVGSTLVSFRVYSSASAQTSDINTNGNPSLIGGPTQPHTYGQNAKYSNMTVLLDRLSILTTHSANGFTTGAADFSGVAGYGLKDFAYGTTGTVPGGDYGVPSLFGTGLSIGLLGSANGNNDQCYLSNVTCHGGYTYAFFATEHTVCSRICILYSWAALVVVGTYFGSVGATHGMWFGQVSTEGCLNVIYVEGIGSNGIGPFLHIDQLDTENAAPTFLDNTSGTGLAALLGTVTLTGLYTPDNITVPSPTGLKIRNGQAAYPARTVTAAYTVKVHDQTIYADATSGSLAVTLISAAWTPNTYTVKKTDSSSNPVVITAASGQTIDGASTFSLTVPGQAVTVAPVGGSGTAWRIITGAPSGGASITENVNTVATSGASQTIPAPTTATLNDITLSNNCTLTFPTATAGWSFSVVLRQDSTGGRTVTWPSGTKWASGSAPVLTSNASGVDVLSFLCTSASAGWMGFTSGQDMR